MKQKMKRVFLVLCLVACFFTLSACSKASDGEEEIDPQTVYAIEETGKQQLTAFTKLTPESIESYKKQFEMSRNTVMVSALESWVSAEKELGGLISIDSTKVEMLDGDYMLTVSSTFEKHPMDMTMISDYEGNITSLSFGVTYSMGEKMEQALMNMIMGMGTVFIVLIFISWIISCFKYINVWEKNMRDKKAIREKAEVPALEKAQPAAPAPVPAPAPAQAAPEPVVYGEPEIVCEDLTDDMELVAVITAAIAATQSVPVEGLVVRSIRRKSTARWKNA